MIGVLGILVLAALAPGGGAPGRGDAATHPRTPTATYAAVAATPLPIPPAEVTSARSAEPCRQAEAARGPVFPCPRVSASAFHADTPVAAPPRRHEPDPWLGDDKLKHFLMSFAVTGFGYGGARTIRLGHDPALAAAAGAGVLAGIGKELRDRFTGGDVSARDLAWDAAGIVVGIVLAGHSR